MKSNIHEIIKKIVASRQVTNLRLTSIPVSKILRGGEGEIPGNQYSRLVNEPLRSSTPAIDSPHVKLLQQYSKCGDAIFTPELFDNTDYYRNARQCIDYLGHYFGITEYQNIVMNAKFFINSMFLEKIKIDKTISGHTPIGAPIILRPIIDSDYYEILDGSHRVAIAVARGDTHVQALVRRKKARTPAQDILRDVLWQKDRVELYQPVTLPEVEGWPVVRQCEDRFFMMCDFIDSTGIKNNASSYLDIGCSYGWFVDRIQKKYEIVSHGVDIDPFALEVGYCIYGIPMGNLFRHNISQYLVENGRKYDITSLFSVLHHYVLMPQSLTPEQLIRQVDKITGLVLFFDTGQENEEWFHKKLGGWTPSFIKNWIKENTSFREIVEIGKDSDRNGWNGNNYERSLFACIR